MKTHQIKKILLITLSNIGDVVLTTPVVDILRKNFSDASFHLMIGPNATGVFSRDKRIDKIIIYDKHIRFKEKITLFFSLKGTGYDLVVDLRNTLFPLFLRPKFYTSPFKNAPKEILSMRERHLWKLKTIGINTDGAELSIVYDERDLDHIKLLFKNYGIDYKQRYICVSCGAKSHIKRWPKDRFSELAKRLINELGYTIILTGDREDKPITSEIVANSKERIFDFAGLTTITELAALLKNSSLLITNDSATLHIASSTDIPVLAIFGPTDPLKYGPNSKKSIVIRKPLKCSPCEVALCRFNHECMELISVDEVFQEAKILLQNTENRR
ncbi:MAG: glycosyltransferase family 9 protein [Candidatus Omnitrophica bacterium]|nr:glycosyltransferase family 9 protein [Candidatus Omnitrophota bacterium]